MTRLAGFDAVAEFGPAALLAALRADRRLQPYLPPAEFRERLTDRGGGEAHFIVDELGLLLTEPGKIVLRLRFIGASVVGNALVGRGFDRQSGVIDIAMPLTLAVGDRPEKRVLRLATARSDIQIETRFDTERRSSGLVADFVTAAVEQQIASRLDSAIDVELPIRVDPASPGLDPLTAAAMDMRIFTDADPARQSIALFLAFRSPREGNAAVRTGADLPAGTDIELTISAAAVRDVIVAPRLQQWLRVPSRDALPAEFGSAAGVGMPVADGPPETADVPVERSNVRIERIAIALETDRIGGRIWARVVGSGANGGDVTAFAVGHLSVSLRNGALGAEWTTDSLDANDSLLSGLGLGAIVSAAANENRDRYISRVPTIRVPVPQLLPGLAFSRVHVTPAHISLSGVAAPPLPRGAHFTIGATATTTDLDRRQVDEGIYNSRFCPLGDYPYRVHIARQQIRLDAAPRFEHAPVHYRWSIWTSEDDIALDGNGRATVTVPRTRPGPPPVGDDSARMEIGFSVSEDTVRLDLQAPADGGLFALNVRCVATDAIGRQASWTRQLHFATRTVDFSGTSWNEDQAQCAERLRQQLEALDSRAIAARSRAPGGLRLDLALPAIRLEALAALAGREARQLAGTIRNMAMRHGAALPLALALGQIPGVGATRGRTVPSKASTAAPAAAHDAAAISPGALAAAARASEPPPAAARSASRRIRRPL